MSNFLRWTVPAVLLALAAPVAGQDRVSADLMWRETPRPGATVQLGVILEIDHGWHVQAGKGSGDDQPPYLPTEVALELPAGWTAGEVMWPSAITFQLGQGSFAETLRGYEGRVLVVVPVQVPADLDEGSHPVRATIGYQACDDDLCQMPKDTRASTTVLVTADGVRATPPPRRGVPALFEAIDARYGASVPRLEIETAWYEGNLLPGREGSLGIVLQVAPGWRVGVAGGGDLEDTTIDVALPPGWTAGDVMWPRAVEIDGGKPHYQGRSMAIVPVEVPAGAEKGVFDVGVTVRYQASDGTTRNDPAEIATTARTVVDPDDPGLAAPLPRDLAALFQETFALAAEKPAEKSSWADPSKLRWWISLVFVFAAMAWMVVRTVAITPRLVPRAITVVAALAVMATYTPFVLGVTSASKFVPYTDAAFEQAMASGDKTVLIKFTADWCANCQVNERLILANDEAAAELARPDVIAFKVDLTGDNPQGEARKDALGGGGIPLIAVYSPKRPEPVKIRGQLAGAQPVIDALRGEIVASGESDEQVFDFLNWRFAVNEGATLVIFGLAFLAGVFMNLTPCVLPVIPLKILSLQAHAKNPARCFLLGLIFGLGIITLYAILGVLMAGFATGAERMDWGAHFSSGWFTGAVGLIVGAMGIGMLGVFSIRLPRFVYMFDPQSDTLRGSFFMGVFTAVLSTPCTGPLLGAAVAWTAKQPASIAFSTLLIMGVGMAFPYVLLTARPQWLDRLPRTGPGSELVKQVMGLLLIAVASWFLGAGVAALAG